MSFARNFALGQQIAQTALDTYETVREKSRLRAIAEAKPTEIENAYTTQDAEHLRAIANAKGAQGNPYYTLQANPDGSYGLKPNFEYTDQDGQMVQPGGVASTFAPRSRVVEFLGTRYAPEDLNEDRIAGIRARAMADVVAERDPVRGLQMRQSIKASERDDIRFGWEQDRQPLTQRKLEQEVRQGELAVADAESARAWKEGFGKAMAAYTGSPEQIAATVPYVNTSSRSITMDAPDPKTGLVNMSVVKPDGSSVFMQLNRADQARLYAAATMMETHPVEALREISAVNKDLAEAVARENQLTNFLAGNRNDVAAKNHKMWVDNQGLGLRLREAGRPNIQLIGTDANGQPVYVDVNRLRPGADGRVQLPAGVTPMRLPQSLSDAEMIAYERAIEQVAALPPDAPPGAAAEIFRRYGLDPQRFMGNAGLPTSHRFGGGGGGGGGGGSGGLAPSGRLTPIPPPDVTRPSRLPAYGNPANFERRSERGLFGGVNYYYFDPATGRKLTLEEYNRLLGR